MVQPLLTHLFSGTFPHGLLDIIPLFYGDQNHAPDLGNIKNGAGESWDMWKNIARQAVHGEYGNHTDYIW